MNYEEFMKEALDSIQILETGRFKEKLLNYHDENNIKSPIEKMFLAAFCFIKQLETLNVCIYPQYTIGKYNVDFLVCKSNWRSKGLIIELDGHNFHDRDEKQRRHEKERDRFLQSEKYKVFHYTGKEITDNPYQAVMDAVNYLYGEKSKNLSPFKTLNKYMQITKKEKSLG